MEKVSVQYLPEIEDFINNLSDLLFEKEYFSFYEYSANYVDNLTFFIEKELFNFPHKITPIKLKKFGSNYAFINQTIEQLGIFSSKKVIIVI